MKIKPLKKEWFEIAQKRLDSLTKPRGSLGRLEEFAAKLVAIFENKMPAINKKAVFVFAGDHGIVEEGVSAFPKEVTAQMVYNFLRGGAGINVLARHAGADVIVIDIGVDADLSHINHPNFISRKVVWGTRNFKNEPAMTKEEAEKCINIGIELAHKYIDQGYNLLATGDMGIGNTTPSSAVCAAITGQPVKDVVGRGTGINDHILQHKIKVIEEALNKHKPDPSDALDVLSKVGGAEIGAIAGLILGAAEKRIPVVIDGFISTAGALIAYTFDPAVKDYIFAGHLSEEKGHRVMLEYMGLEPILRLNMRLGEGTGAALAMTIIEAGLKIYKEMATFDEAGVSEEKK
ncbi:nicotinate-nucleotide--dimethylbenzimidazole phosphoribosyltransferase [Thermodesulfobacterium hydrogeniphilum]|uniref:nicotinate-nucleotide--dimethylbenzimidazole phosphoribosyltransferase n=1 Tax=Thermodesulfobacterium hydrogeniphilum TaxID=161156 RepID=UPI00056F4CDB|nr:nicotinate-nucleotide--dimethylbenzimidazole phosphoribosyltransferase [Thermodesulfobacterium hydrogeniphilum]